MFDSAVPPRFRIDPWAAEYGAALLVDDEDEGARGPEVDTSVETSDWDAPIEAHATERPAEVVFVDGVQRVEAWGRIEAGGQTVEAALASLAVGATISRTDAGASLEFRPPSRVLAVSNSVSTGALRVRAGSVELTFEPQCSSTPGHKGVSDAVSLRRSELERRFAEDLCRPDRLVVLDGRLSFDPSGVTPVVGLAKSIHRLYLTEPQARLLPRLGAGQRTPVFRIAYGETGRYSWFLRLAASRPVHHALAGVVRLETTEVGVEDAVRLANLTAFLLPQFASRPEHDPRAPQNLLPVGALERRLRHEMGDPAFIRRAIEDQLQQEAGP